MDWLCVASRDALHIRLGVYAFNSETASFGKTRLQHFVAILKTCLVGFQTDFLHLCIHWAEGASLLVISSLSECSSLWEVVNLTIGEGAWPACLSAWPTTYHGNHQFGWPLYDVNMLQDNALTVLFLRQCCKVDHLPLSSLVHSCVSVLYLPKRNRELHILNTSRFELCLPVSPVASFLPSLLDQEANLLHLSLS